VEQLSEKQVIGAKSAAPVAGHHILLTTEKEGAILFLKEVE
jgi:hypothetical protein